MQVQRIQNNYHSPSFNAKIADSGALRRFKAGLNKSEKNIFDSCVTIIENSKDRNNYIFDYIKIGKAQKIREIAAISVINTDGTIRHPSLLAGKSEDALDLFKQLSKKCKSETK